MSSCVLLCLLSALVPDTEIRIDSSNSQPWKVSSSTSRTVTISSQPKPEPLPRQKTNSRKPSGMVPEDPSSVPYHSNDDEGDRDMGRILESEGGRNEANEHGKEEEHIEGELEVCDSPTEERAPPSSK
ncbi:hypothetical protein FB451DRAFT_1362306 [Mycena latifolia]|nr:hypothetical protein FB451DRAFT_1362306 [Mycena latifolia]